MSRIFLVRLLISSVLTLTACIGILLLIPKFLGNELSSFVITSGSMEPVIPTGSVVLIQNTKTVTTGDIIAFQSPNTSKEIIIHRLIGLNQSETNDGYLTKGDNNNTADAWIVPATNIIGTVIVTIPLVGYMQQLLQNPLWFMVLVGIPVAYLGYKSTLLIFDGFRDIKAKNRIKNHSTLIIVAISYSILLGTILIKSPARSLFSTQSTISNISISAAVLTPTPTSSPIPTPTKKPGTVIIISDNGEGSENEVIIENSTQQTVTSTTSTTTQTSIQTELNTGGNTVQP